MLPPPPKATEPQPTVRVDLLRPKAALANPPSRVSTGTLLRMEGGDPNPPGAYVNVGPLATTPPQPTISPRTAQDLRSQNDSLQTQLQSAVEQLQQMSIQATPMPVDERSFSEAQLLQLQIEQGVDYASYLQFTGEEVFWRNQALVALASGSSSSVGATGRLPRG